ncbi:MAG: hypothetical protein KDB82_13100 [Planctomycetes bacterium]|nr:hypothetical protein [Planctomycetota bacterium]
MDPEQHSTGENETADLELGNVGGVKRILPVWAWLLILLGLLALLWFLLAHVAEVIPLENPT